MPFPDISADPVAGRAGAIRAEQHHSIRTVLVHAEHEHLAADSADLPGGQVHRGDHGAAGELLGCVVIGQPARGSPGAERPEVDQHPVGGAARLRKRLAAHDGPHPDVDGEELRRIDLGQLGTLSTHASQCIGTYTRPRYLTPFGGNVIAGLRRIAVILTASLLLLTGCGTPSINAASLLTTTKDVLDGTASFHFVLSSEHVSGSGALLTGGSGDMKRPASMSGSLQVSVLGLALTVPVVSVGGTFSVKLPTSSAFSTANPADYGFADPARLIAPIGGLSSLLLACRSPQVESDDRYNGESLHEIGCTLPGQAVAALLTSADPSKSVAATFGIDTSTNQLRRVALTGPFVSRSTDSTYTLVLTNYGENVTVTPPPAAG